VTKERKRREQEVNGTLEKHTIRKKCRELNHLKESLAVFGAHFPDKKREPVKTSTMSDVLKDSAK
jgi:hypothetical protein